MNYVTIMEPTEELARKEVFRLWNESDTNIVRWRRPDNTIVYPVDYAHDQFEWLDESYVIGWDDDAPNHFTEPAAGAGSFLHVNDKSSC